MKITVLGHCHLAYITAAGMEKHHKVSITDESASSADVVWACYDTPVSSEGVPNVEWVANTLRPILKTLKKGTVVVISSQISVGTSRMLQNEFPLLSICYSPENLRRGNALECFLYPERIVVGTSSGKPNETVDRLLAPLESKILWMTLESAEMVKHALNSFLALSIAFIHEIDVVCKATNADINDVSQGLQTDKRIGLLSYLKPGGPYTKDTLGREIVTVNLLNTIKGLGLDLFPAIDSSNNKHIERDNR